MRIAVLGPVEVQQDGRAVDLGVRKQRALLAALALSPGRVVPTGTLVGLVWGDSAPTGAVATLQTYVAGLRRALEPARAARSAAGVLLTAGDGYFLRVPDEAIDAIRFERVVRDAQRALGTTATEPLPTAARGNVRGPRRLLEEALELWRGTPYAELGDAPAAIAERARLVELRLVAEELSAVARLLDGEHAVVAADLERATTEHPLRERLWGLRAVALARSGRQGDALEALRHVRQLLADELGVDPGPDLRRVEEAVLRQDPALTWAPPVAAAPPAGRRADEAAPAGAAPDPRLASTTWPLLGRKESLAQLCAALDAAETGRPAFAAVVGEPGIGKSRLAAELAGRARARGFRVLVGRCSQDEGAPPLWPWTSVLADLPGGPVTALFSEDQPAQDDRFRAWDQLCRTLTAATDEQPVLVVLDDLQWADSSSLRVLRHLVTASTGRLAVLVTWRRPPEPTGPLAEAAEALARRHALRIDLHGLGAEEAGQLVAAVAGIDLPARDRELFISRTDGNPFFLVEYARLLQGPPMPVNSSRPAEVAEGLPLAIADVLTHRLAAQPPDSQAALRAAAVLGREVSLPLVAAVLSWQEDAVLDALDAALTAGLVVEDGVDRFRFSHALVRDAVYKTVPLSRRARLHARAAAVWAAAPTVPQALSEAARHWLSAGPVHAARAWRAAVDAAAEALRVHGYEEARDLLRTAVDAQRRDPDCGALDRYEVLMALGDACRRAADWNGLTAATDEAVAAAEAAGDVERAARAAIGTSQGALWLPRQYGITHEPVVSALRRALAGLPAGDGELRCRVMLALAVELYYAAAPREREALAEQAVAMARRISDPELLHHAFAVAFLAVWRPATAECRLALATEAHDRAMASGDPTAQATAATLRAIVLFELGRVAEATPVIEQALTLAEHHRLSYLRLVLYTLRAPWLAMAGRFDEAEVMLSRLLEHLQHVSLPQAADSVAGALLTVRLFQGRLAELLPQIADLTQQVRNPVTAGLAAFLLRLDRRDDAAAVVAAGPPIDLGADTWLSMLTWCTSAEVALGLGDRELAASAYARAAPYAGRMCVGGSGCPLGPVDAFLSLAAAATGETTTAATHAERALRLCAEWDLPPVARWLRDQRRRQRF